MPLLRAVGVAFVLVGLAMAVAPWFVVRNDRRVMNDGVAITAEVTDKHAVQSSDGDSDFIVEYGFSVPDGSNVIHEWAIGRERWEALAVGDPIAIHYLDGDPPRSLPDGTGATFGLATFVTIVGVLLAAIGVVALIAKPASPVD